MKRLAGGERRRTGRWAIAIALLLGIVLSIGFGAAQAAPRYPIKQNRLLGPGVVGFDRFGASVAIDGDTAVVGAYFGALGATRTGEVYVYVRSGSTWSLQANFTASDAAQSMLFGWEVSLSGDTIVVGTGGTETAYVFVRSGTTWTEQAKLTASDGSASDQFGMSVAVSGDIAVVGARFDDDRGQDSGSAYVFVRSGTAWTEQAKLTASDGSASDHFGNSVSISGDTVAVGATADSDAGDNAGSAYVFVRSGDNWNQQAKVIASNAGAGEFFGADVAVSGDDLVVGAPGGDTSTHNRNGAAYVYTRSGTSWSEEARLLAANGKALDHFGSSVSLQGDFVAVGAPDKSGMGAVSAGSVYVFERSGGSWAETVDLFDNFASNNDTFGSAVSVSGETLLVGLPGDVFYTQPYGSVYVYVGLSDTDGDGLADFVEVERHQTNPLVADTDGDGLSDGDEVNLHRSDPLRMDSDSDGLSDSSEVNDYQTSPTLADTDSDGLSDFEEVTLYPTDPLVWDTDNDGLSDGVELNTWRTDPLKPDTDGDGLSDKDELTKYLTDPLDPDTDGDGISDGEEVRANGDPRKAPNPPRNGYWMLERDGTIYDFGDAAAYGAAGLADGDTTVAFDSTPAGDGLWILDSAGRVHARGKAVFYGEVDLSTLASGDRVASISASSTGQGYWVFTELGQVFAFGRAGFYGDLPSKRIAPVGRIVASSALPSGQGYYMLGSDGGVFAFGNAQFAGSIPQVLPPGSLSCPIVGLVPVPEGVGYWMVACDGGVFAFGDAQFHGSIPGVLTAGQQLNSPINGLVPYGSGYLMVASDGGVFSFSDKPFIGSLGENPPDTPIVAIKAQDDIPEFAVGVTNPKIPKP